MINRLKFALRFLLASQLAMLAEKEGVARLQSTLYDVEYCDWFIAIQSNKVYAFGWSQMTVTIDQDILEKLCPLKWSGDLDKLRATS